MAVAPARFLDDIYFNERESPDLLAAAEHLDSVGSDDSVQHAVAAVLARRRRAQLAERGISVGAWKCPCFLREGRGRLHRRHHGADHEIGRCYDLGDHPRGWYRGKDLVALTYEPYDGHSAAGAGRLAQAVDGRVGGVGVRVLRGALPRHVHRGGHHPRRGTPRPPVNRALDFLARLPSAPKVPCPPPGGGHGVAHSGALAGSRKGRRPS
ncbi:MULTISPECIES: hypothetical protein [unclassified Nocardiopsis]|uniref:hypothetical protein n=1 Tax=unclassified Nocardiopsis TaxID=2649073 RepID=UPI0011613B84|nr:hypothetical protein [Nocardiopsis sp. TSRI0078]